jgi:hypothetical protein
MISQSIEYSKEALIGKWARWIIFVILGLPMALLPFVFDVDTIAKTTDFSWEQVPWGQVAALVIAGILLSFFLSGYVVRIYRGVQPAPDFDDWGALFLDGLKMQVLGLIWFLPVIIPILVLVALSLAGLSGPGPGSMGLAVALLVMLVIMMVVLLVVSLFIPMALIRFARTGSIREGLRYSEINAHIGRIGWGQYIVALIVLVAVSLIFGVLITVLALIPFIGWVLQLILTPLLTVFTARFYTLVYEQGMEQPVVA